MSGEVLGDLTAARARDDEAANALISSITGLDARIVQRRLRDAHGKTRVRTVFAAEWPDEEETLGRLRVKQAREAGLVTEIVDLTQLSERTVRARLNDAHGAALVANVFDTEWPSLDGGEIAEDDDDPVALGEMTVAAARLEDDAAALIAGLTGYAPAVVERKLRDAHGATLVRNVFIDRWPTDADELGDLRVREARDCGLSPEIARVTGMTVVAACSMLTNGDGRMVVRNLFEATWPRSTEQDDLGFGVIEDEEEDGGATALGVMTVAAARLASNAAALIAGLTGYAPNVVERKLRDAHGATLVRNVFVDRWPADADDLGDLRVRQARDCGFHAEIALVTRMTADAVRARLNASDGRMAVRNLFAAVWPRDEEDDLADELGIGVTGEDEEEEENEKDGRTLSDRLRLDPGGAWSRPRQLARVLRQLGMGTFQRLRTPRFQEVLQILAQGGVELRLADDESGEPLPLDASSPGIDAEVRLRGVAGGSRDTEQAGQHLIFIGQPPLCGTAGLMEIVRRAGITSLVDVRFPLPREGAWTRDALSSLPGYVRSTVEADPEIEVDGPTQVMAREARLVAGAFHETIPALVVGPILVLTSPRFEEGMRAAYRAIGVAPGLDIQHIVNPGADPPASSPAELLVVNHAQVMACYEGHPCKRRALTEWFDGAGDLTRDGGRFEVKETLVRRQRGSRISPRSTEVPGGRSSPLPPPPVVVVAPRKGPAAPPPLVPREADYDIALRRLQFLTAVPSVNRHHEQEWPDSYLVAATAGLDILPLDEKHLRMVATSIVKGHHSPSPIIGPLVKGEAPADLDTLLHRFIELNRNAPDFAQEVLNWVNERRGHTAPAPKAPPQRDEPPRTRAPAPAWTRAASGARQAGASEPAPQSASANVRDMGALDDMFD